MSRLGSTTGASSSSTWRNAHLQLFNSTMPRRTENPEQASAQSSCGDRFTTWGALEAERSCGSSRDLRDRLASVRSGSLPARNAHARRVGVRQRSGRCWARTSDLRLVETEARGQDLTGQVKKGHFERLALAKYDDDPQQKCA